MDNLLLVIDVESDGLLGEAFAVGAVVLNQENGEVIDAFKGKVMIEISSEFVLREVLPQLDGIRTFESKKTLDLAFYDFYQRYSVHEKLVDAGFPVETNFLKRVFSRIDEPIMPYPLYDLVSILKAKNLDPLLDRFEYLNSKLTKHHPQNDALVSGLIYLKLLKAERNGVNNGN